MRGGVLGGSGKFDGAAMNGEGKDSSKGFM
jgi:hypothetical protein